jgi:hypothetical protein
MTKKTILTLLILATLNGCAATGAAYSVASHSEQLDADKARLILFRTRESSAMSARTASVKLDNKPVEGVKYAGFTFIDTNPGLHSLAVDLPDTFGKCLLSIEVTNGNEYFFQIRPRLETLFIGGAVGAILADGQPASPKREDCKGSFFIEQVEKSIAQEKLNELKSSH